MSKITNDDLTRSGTGCFIAVPIWQGGRQRVKQVSSNHIWLLLATVLFIQSTQISYHQTYSSCYRQNSFPYTFQLSYGNRCISLFLMCNLVNSHACCVCPCCIFGILLILLNLAFVCHVYHVPFLWWLVISCSTLEVHGLLWHKTQKNLLFQKGTRAICIITCGNTSLLMSRGSVSSLQ